MDNSFEYVYVLPVIDRWLLHAPLHGITALVNTHTLNAIKNHRYITAEIETLAEMLNQSVTSIPQPPKGSVQPEFLGIIPTRECNFSCLYCGFDADDSTNGKMDLDLATSAVDWMIEHSHTRILGEIDIHFFGGEPFCAPDVVDVIIHRTRLRASDLGLKCRFIADTNGYFDENRCQFIGDYFSSVIVSLDGTEVQQNLLRPTRSGKNSFNKVAQNAYQLSKSPTELCLRVCVTQNNVNQLGSIANWFCKQFRPSIINFEPLKPTQQSNQTGLEPPDPYEFAINYMDAHFVSYNYGVKSIYSAASVDKIQNSVCPVGRDALIVSPDGKVNACYLQEEEWNDKNLNFNMGKIDQTGRIILEQKAVDNIRNITIQKRRCQKCISRWHCAGGCHVTNYYANQSDHYDDFCFQTRIIVACMLLQELGFKNDLNQLLQDRNALEKLNCVTSDRLWDWEE